VTPWSLPKEAAVEVIAVIIGALLVVVLVVVVVLLVRAKAPEPAQRPDGPAPWSSDAEAGARVVLDVVVDDPSAPSVQRLVQEAIERKRREERGKRREERGGRKGGERSF
jgi:hypothetical protein